MPIIINTDLIIVNNQDSSSYDDFTPHWYKSKGTSLIIGAYARAFVPVWELGFRFWLPRLFQWYDRKFTSNRGTTRQTNFNSYLKVYKNQSFDIERSYAEIMGIIFFTSFYFNILPHMVFPGLVNLVLIFWKDKILSKNSKKIFFNFFQI